MQRNDDDPNTPLYYAPRWLRERPIDLQSLQASADEQKPLPFEAPEAPLAPQQREKGQQLHDNSDLFEEAVRQALREALEPEVMPPPPVDRKKPKRGSIFGMLARWTGVAAVTAVAATVVFVPFADDRATQSKVRATLDVKNGIGSINEMLDLGVRLSSPVPGGTVLVKGLPSGARLTAGIRLVSGEWRVPLGDLEGLSVVPPSGFRGQANVNVNLIAPDGAKLDSNSVRLAWTTAEAAPVKVAAQSSPANKVSTVPVRLTPAEPALPVLEPIRQSAEPVRPVAEPVRKAAEPVPMLRPAPEPARPAEGTVRRMDPNEVAGLVKRAEELLASGDILPARLLLMRAAEARHARAAHLLATSYDPALLKRFGEYGAAADMTMAQNWYQKARDWGHSGTELPRPPQSPPQVETLATFGR